MSDSKAAKIAAARRKLKDHQEKKNSQCIDAINLDNAIKTQTVENVVPHPSQIDNSSQFVSEQGFTSQFITSDKTDKHVLAVHDSFGKNELEFNQQTQNNISVTEILVAEKRNLELKINSLESYIETLNYTQSQSMLELDTAKVKAVTFESELKDAKEHIKYLQCELECKNKDIENFKTRETEWLEIKNELEEKLESINTAFTTCSTQNVSLTSQLTKCQHELEMSQLQLQLLTNGDNVQTDTILLSNDNLEEQNKALQVNISKMKQQIEMMLNDKEQIAAHYKHYTDELQVKIESAIARNREIEAENERLNYREANLIDQISEMEIRIQALQNHIAVLDNQNLEYMPHKSSGADTDSNHEIEAVREKTKAMEAELEIKQNQLNDSELKITELTNTIEQLQHEQPDILKLTAANESDKVAAQRATTQNIKLKEELHGLQEAFVTMSNDKLQLTEKIQAEKFLNRELTIKLSEAEETLKELQSKLKAKDDEMIRLQEMCSKLDKQILFDSQEIDRLRHYEVTKSTEVCLIEQLNQAKHEINKLKNKFKSENNTKFFETSPATTNVECADQANTGTEANCDAVAEKHHIDDNQDVLPTEEAMLKLQQRFLRTMKEVAELSEEKQNLEHIVLQLQDETETICEYVALYQQQRGILKQREEERREQMKYLSAEREKMQARLEQLQLMITKTVPENKEFNSTVQNEKVEKIVSLLTEIKLNPLIDPHKQCSGIQTFHPCPWCSGKLIDV